MFTKVVGPKPVLWVGKIVSYLFFSRNPIILIFYLSLVGSSLFKFFRDLYPMVIDSPVLGKVHAFVYIPIIFVLLVFSFLKAALTDPGTINKQNVELYLKLYPYDNQFFFPRECVTCKIMKPARSKHCKFLNKCVPRYDHYCSWLMNSIGEKNYRWFLLFLFSNSLMCCYGSYILFKFLYFQIEDEGLFTNTFYDEDGFEIETGFKFYLSFLVYFHRRALLLFLLAFIMGLVVVGFFLFQFLFIKSNITTNESYKKAWLQDYITNKSKQQRSGNLTNTNKKTSKKQRSSANKDQKKKNETRSEKKEKRKESLIKQKNHQQKKLQLDDYADILLKIDPNNINSYYNQGFWKNFLEIIFPLSTRKSNEIKQKKNK
ncbi:palmitoyltransferase [Anaeramoeba flamelloides]|uniref:Palmitoyltransferase n=1 Tax=Anaeramoeba flamelloides TaxID=1746091 RepID=A0AAV7YV23_9EUKA|nr:palmitoyltransferase [Anaeramoeba flamelloides]